MMCHKFLGPIFSLAILSVFVALPFINSSEIPGLPFCPNKNSSSVLLVSTLDGKLSAVNSTGSLLWEIQTGPGPLLTSNIHNQELTNHGEWIRIIPSLSGNLYQFDGSSIDPISISAEILLKSSLKYSENLVIAGGIEVRTYGIGFRSGKVLYECTQHNCTNAKGDDVGDVLLVERNTQTVRALEPRSGTERWNFSVGMHDIKLPQVSCIDTKPFHWNVSAIVPEGLLMESANEKTWQYKFASPIVRVWAWNGASLSEINLFTPKNILPLVSLNNANVPSIYLGMHNLQLYVHESHDMLHQLHHKHPELANNQRQRLPKIPWKPIAANFEITEDDSTALSVLNNSGYINGNGYYLYSESSENEESICAENESIINEPPRITFEDKRNLEPYKLYYKELLLLLVTAIISPIIFKLWNNSNPKLEKIIIVEKPVQANITQSSDNTAIAESKPTFSSRYTEDFETIRCLGKGGFGVVFEVKQNIDECHYAIKRITLPHEAKSRSRVMREVRALAKLEHKNIVRYFCSWLEYPPIGWEKNHDKQWLGASMMEPLSEESTTHTSQLKPRQKSYSVSIQIPSKNLDDVSDDSCITFESESQDDSFIVFTNSSEGESKQNFTNDNNSSETIEKQSFAKDNSKVSDYYSKKINWKRPDRKHHSWDASHSNIIELKPSTNPPVFLYIQMQLCQKESLKEWLSVNKIRDYPYILNLFSQILDAVEYVHIRGLIHRDLKPGNIFFSLEGQIKVGDFGLVKDMEGPLEYEHYSSHSHRGHTREVGTHLYMSPEQFRSSSYDYKVDIFALGVILFELLVPFSTDMERIQTLTNVKKQIFPQEFSKKFPDEYDLLQDMLNPQPSKRLTTIGIRSKKPFKTTEGDICEEKYHYDLNGLMKKT